MCLFVKRFADDIILYYNFFVPTFVRSKDILILLYSPKASFYYTLNEVQLKTNVVEIHYTYYVRFLSVFLSIIVYINIFFKY